MAFDIQSIQKKINDEILKLDFKKSPHELYTPIEYILSLGGKRVRPLFVILGYSLFSSDIEKIIKPAIAVELFHNFTLIHDDIMDEAPLRRGNPTVHQKWNTNTAILSGDALLIKAYELLFHVDDLYYKKIIEKFNTCATEVCEGQQLDMNYEKEINISESEYIEMIRLKTAVLLGFALEMGGIIANAKEKDYLLLKEFGTSLGIGFQLMDDLLDSYGSNEKFGKKIGGDIVANKKTFLLIKALEEKKYRSELIQLLSQSTFDKEEKIKSILSIYNELEIKKRTEEKINFYFNQAFTYLEKIDIAKEKKEIIKKFTNDLLIREN